MHTQPTSVAHPGLCANQGELHKDMQSSRALTLLCLEGALLCSSCPSHSLNAPLLLVQPNLPLVQLSFVADDSAPMIVQFLAAPLNLLLPLITLQQGAQLRAWAVSIANTEYMALQHTKYTDTM